MRVPALPLTQCVELHALGSVHLGGPFDSSVPRAGALVASARSNALIAATPSGNARCACGSTAGAMTHAAGA